MGRSSLGPMVGKVILMLRCVSIGQFVMGIGFSLGIAPLAALSLVAILIIILFFYRFSAGLVTTLSFSIL